MGLDTVELVMAFEEEFGIHIDNAAAAACSTPKQVADYVHAHVRTSRGDPCPSQRGFYRVRRALLQCFDCRRRDIEPASQLRDFLEPDIRANWERLRRELGADDFPRLERSSVFVAVAVLLLPAVPAIPLLYMQWPIRVVVIGYIVLAVIIDVATRRYGRILPKGYRNVASLIPFVDCCESKLWEYDAILRRVIEITSEQLGIPIEDIDADSHFVNDLGAD
ncbi:MAG: hypothetical protein ACU84J_14755 [Gammaproteobacteria bacterium]